MAVTPRVFWAVSATMADMPCAPQRAKAFRSAWMPAPPPESEEAIVRTLGIMLLPLLRHLPILVANRHQGVAGSPGESSGPTTPANGYVLGAAGAVPGLAPARGLRGRDSPVLGGV